MSQSLHGKVAEILGMNPEIFVAENQNNSFKNPRELQRGLIFLNFVTSMSGQAVIDGDIGDGTRRSLRMFAAETDLDHFDPERFVDHIADKADGMDVTFDLNVEYLDRLDSKSNMPALEIFSTYWDDFNENEYVQENDFNPRLLLAIVMVETAGVARARFEEHVWRRNTSLSDYQRRHHSSSFGLFQEMGFNLVNTGFPCDHLADQGDVEAQLEAIVKFINVTPVLSRELKKVDNVSYSEIAYSYNGSGYRKNRYHTKLANAHREIETVWKTFTS